MCYQSHQLPITLPSNKRTAVGAVQRSSRTWKYSTLVVASQTARNIRSDRERHQKTFFTNGVMAHTGTTGSRFCSRGGYEATVTGLVVLYTYDAGIM